MKKLFFYLHINYIFSRTYAAIHIFTFLIILFILFGNCSHAQLPVRMEPRHHKVFENDYVRVLDVHIVPGDTTLFHIHETPSVFIILTNAKTGSEILSKGVATAAELNPANLWFDGFYSGPRIHRIWNKDTIEYHVMDVELLNKSYKPIGLPLKDKSLHQVLDEKPVRAYTCLLNRNAIIHLPSRKCPLLIVALSESQVSVGEKLFKQKGDFSYTTPGNKTAITNRGIDAARLAIIELK
jgi:hypothetical protein